VTTRFCRTRARGALSTLALTGAIGAVGMLSAAAGAAAPAIHGSFDAAGDVFACGDREYTVVEGVVKTLDRFSVGPTGNEQGGFVLRLSGVVAEDAAGERYALHGVVRNSFSYRSAHDDETASFAGHVQIIEAAGGSVGRVAVLFHINTVNGKLRDVDYGNCELP